MTLYTGTALAALALFVGFTLSVARRPAPSGTGNWWVPAVASVLFAAFSLAAIAQGGPFGFWPVHTASLWGLQVWLDLNQHLLKFPR